MRKLDWSLEVRLALEAKLGQTSLFEISQNVLITPNSVTDEYRSVAQANLITGDNEQGRKKERELNVSHVSVKTSESWRRLVTIWRLF